MMYEEAAHILAVEMRNPFHALQPNWNHRFDEAINLAVKVLKEKDRELKEAKTVNVKDI